MAASGLNAVIPNTSKVTIFYNGSVHIYDGIPADKVIIAALRYEYWILQLLCLQSKSYIYFLLFTRRCMK